MAGDYSRRTFDQEKHYSGVLMQQGRVQLDADWNEQVAIQQYRTELLTTDLVGASGVPKQNNGFRIGVSARGNQLTISPGHIYVDGLLCELSEEATYAHQPHYNPDLNEPYFRPPDLPIKLPTRPTTNPLVSRPTDLSTSLSLSPPASPPESPPASPPLSPPEAGMVEGTYLVYLEAWQREINFRDDPHIHEVAMGEVDTTTRLQTVWQVKVIRVSTAGLRTVGCQTAFREWDQLITPVTGKLKVQTKRTADVKDPCSLPPTTGFRRLENQLYRIEIHRGGSLSTSTFKWSRDNASVETKIEDIEGNGMNLTVSDLGRDSVLGFANGQWVEIVDETATLTGHPNALFQIVVIDPDARKITLNRSAADLKQYTNLKLRRWDQASDGIAMSQARFRDGGIYLDKGIQLDNWLDLEDGIQVAFSEGSYQPGDYWLVAARTATGDVEWPRIPFSNEPIPQLPAGTKHHYCRLALLNVQNGVLTVSDCRRQFPSLTEITADDVLVRNLPSRLPLSQTVQQVIDQLYSSQQGSCTLTAKPGLGWESIFDSVPEGQDAEICFQAGDYLLSKAAKITKKGHIKLQGIGPGTRFLAPDLDAGLVFEECKSVLIRDIYAEISRPNKLTPPEKRAQNGVLTFIHCPVVNVEQVTLKCESVSNRSNTCLTVQNPYEGPGSVRIRDCDLQVGNQQQGILLVNVTTALVENNTLRLFKRASLPTVAKLFEDSRRRAGLRRLLFNNPVLDNSRPTSPPAPPINPVLSIGDQRIRFNSSAYSITATAWQKLLLKNPPQAGAKFADIVKHIKRLINQLWLDEKFRLKYGSFFQVIEEFVRQSIDVAARGITIGGQAAQDIRVLNNTIEGSLQGIHIGLSHRQAGPKDIDRAQTITIAGNTINIVIPPWAIDLDRHGVFVGHCKSLLIENNNIRLQRLERLLRFQQSAETDNFSVEGIRVWGELGDRLMVTKNYVASANGSRTSSFTVGIRINPLNKEKPVTAQWVVMWNVAPSIPGGSNTTVVTTNSVTNPTDTNTPA